MHPISVENKPQIKSSYKMILQNYSTKSFWKLLKFRTWFCLPCTLHLNMTCFKCDIYFGYFKATVKKLISMPLFTICKYFTVCTYSKPMGLSLSGLKALCWLCIAPVKWAFSLQISCLWLSNVWTSFLFCGKPPRVIRTCYNNRYLWSKL